MVKERVDRMVVVVGRLWTVGGKSLLYFQKLSLAFNLEYLSQFFINHKINDSFGILMTRSKEIQIWFYRLEHPLHWNWVELNWSPGCHDNRITPNLGESQVDEGNWEPLMRSRKEKKTSIRKLIREARENINLHVVSF